jgi:hypothetical protein
MQGEKGEREERKKMVKKRKEGRILFIVHQRERELFERKAKNSRRACGGQKEGKKRGKNL